jgi:hypothetical protein
MQTSARMWLESIKDWINEILAGPVNPQATGQYVDVGVQTNAPSFFGTVKQWFLEVYSIRSSELSSMGENKVTKRRNNLNSVQSVDHHDSESPLTILRFETDSPLQILIGPDDSVSNISEVISESSLDKLVHPNDSASNNLNRIYDTSNPTDLADLMNDPTIFNYLDISENIYFFMY